MRCEFNSVCVQHRIGRAECICPTAGSHIDPVCGSNGKTYTNNEQLTREACLRRTIIRYTQGACVNSMYLSFISRVLVSPCSCSCVFGSFRVRSFRVLVRALSWFVPCSVRAVSWFVPYPGSCLIPDSCHVQFVPCSGSCRRQFMRSSFRAVFWFVLYFDSCRIELRVLVPTVFSSLP